jgi:predicted transcriptional regulator
MTDEVEGRESAIENCVTEVVAAYVSHNHVAPGDLPALIASVRAAFAGMVGGQQGAPAAAVEKPSPAQIRKSITPDALISFLDGKPYKTLKRHLGTHGLDAYAYRQRFGLPADYPMVAPSYSVRRTEISKRNHFGRHGRT